MGSVVILDRDDDISSTRSKLALAGERIALVIPSECHALNKSLSFRLLRRWRDDTNRQIAIVTRNAQLKRLAIEHGFPTCSSIRGAEALWRTEDAIRQAPPVKAWLLRHRAAIVRRAVLLGALILAVGLALYYALPVATVRLSPLTQPVSDRLELTADPAASSIDYAGARVPARVVASPVEGSDRLPTTGKKEAKARGFVTFGNLTDFEVHLPRGTVVATADGRRFETVATTVVPAPRWSSSRAEVIALEAGAKGEADRLAINRVEGPLSQSVAVLNEQPIVVDKSRSDAVVTEQDREKLRASLFDRLNKQAIAGLNQQLKQYETLVLQSIKVEVTHEEFDHEVGDDATMLSLRLALRATATVFDQRHVAELARKTQESGPQAGRQILPDSVRIGSLEVVGTTGDAVKFATRVEALAMQPLDEDEVRALVAGVSAAEAAAKLQEKLRLEKPPEVKVEPAWASRAYRVNLVVAGPSAVR